GRIPGLHPSPHPSRRTVMIPAPRSSQDYGERWGILNRGGQFWSHNTFDTAAQAWDYLVSYWPSEDDRRGYRVIQVYLAVTPVVSGGKVIDDPKPPKWATAGRRALQEQRS